MLRHRHGALGLSLVLAALGAGCTEDNPATPTDASSDLGADVPVTDAAVKPDVSQGTPDAGPLESLPEGDCDPLDEGACALPWPSNLYLRADSSRATGYALTFGATSLPSNVGGDHIDPRGFRRLDGYGLGSAAVVLFPNLDASALADETHAERSMAEDSSTLLFEVDGTTLRRVPHFVDYDAQETDPTKRVLFLRPLVILKENTRYVVAFRNLRTTGGQAIAPSAAFTRLRDGSTAGDPALGPRQARFDEVFRLLEGAGVQRSTLTLAWDFNTASGDALHGRLLAMRDDALQRVGPTGPELHPDDVRYFARGANDAGLSTDEQIAIEVSGTITVPHYMRPRMIGSLRGWEMNYGPDARPAANGTREARFWVRIPHSAIGGEPHGLVMYGHGLLGSAEEVRAGYNGQIANDHHLIFFAADLTGFAEEDLGPVLATLRDGTNFQYVVDRQHQGLVEWVVLARAIRERLGALPELTSRNVRVNRDELFYSGISQGGIYGGTIMAIDPDITYGHLGVPGNNYATLLHRSTDFRGYLEGVRRAYPATVDQAIMLGCVQLQWDSVDPVSYLRHVEAEPFSGMSPHHVLLAPAKGDHQVAVFTNEIAARSGIGIALMEHYDDERSPFGITPTPYPHRGSGVVLYDYGNPWPAPGNRPPAESDGDDPHGRPRREPWHQRQMVTFFRTGEIIDVCGGDGCHPD
ncbi:MAG: hypothetical protein R3A52_19995 [Polyangiales bacterium]